MKKSEELSRKTRKMIAKNLIVLAVLAVVASVGVVSWFSKNQEAKASGITAKTKVVEGLEYYIVKPSDTDQYNAINSTLAANRAYNTLHKNDVDFVAKNDKWHQGTVTFNTALPEFKFLEDLFLCEVTGDGVTFYSPALSQADGIAYLNPEGDLSSTIVNEDYMSFDIYFRSEAQHDIKLTSDSSIAPINKTISATENEEEAAIGAVRMSVLQNNSDRELLWIPAPNIWYNGKKDQLYTDLTPSEYAGKGTVTYDGSAIALTEEGTNNHAYINSSKNRTIINSDGDTVIAGKDYKLGTDKTVLTLSQTGSDNYKYGHIRVNLWIEGEDAESRLKFVGGKFTMSLNFDFA